MSIAHLNPQRHFQRHLFMSNYLLVATGKQIGTIKPKTRRGREVGFLGETRLGGCEVYISPPA